MSQYNTGYINVSNNSSVWTGDTSEFLANVSIGDLITIVGESVYYTVATITSDTSLTTSTAYQGTTGTGKEYTIVRDFSTNYGLPLPNRGDLDIANLVKQGIEQVDLLLGSGNPGFNAGTLDSLDSTQFLRSDANDTYSGATLTLSSANANINFTNTASPHGIWFGGIGAPDTRVKLFYRPGAVKLRMEAEDDTILQTWDSANLTTEFLKPVEFDDTMTLNNSEFFKILALGDVDDGTEIFKAGGNALHIHYGTNSLIFQAVDDTPVLFNDATDTTKIIVDPDPSVPSIKIGNWTSKHNSDGDYTLTSITDADRLLLVGGISATSTSAAFISIEGDDYGGTSLGGNLVLAPSTNGIVDITGEVDLDTNPLNFDQFEIYGSGNQLVCRNTVNDAGRVLMGAGSVVSSTSGSYIVLEGNDYGGVDQGGAISLVSSGGVDAHGPTTIYGNVTVNGEVLVDGDITIRNTGDGWLRLNDTDDFYNGIFCGASIFRTDGSFQIGNGGSVFNLDSSEMHYKNNIVVISGGVPQLRFDETDASANNGHWRVIASGENFSIQGFDDAWSTNASAVLINRTANTIDNIQLLGTTITMGGKLRLKSYTVATAPTTNSAGDTIYVSDGDAGSPCLATWDGTAWKRISLGATISAT